MHEAHQTAGPVGPVVVHLPGEIDMTNAEDVTRDLAAAFRPGASIVVGDLTSTTFCDSAGIRALALAHQHAAQAGIQLRLAVAADGPVRRVLEIMDLTAVLAIYPSVEAASSGPAGPA
ncbi:MAG TPA: STAS domain-containing protein [Streptosporangiaceae bacterium]